MLIMYLCLTAVFVQFKSYGDATVALYSLLQQQEAAFVVLGKCVKCHAGMLCVASPDAADKYCTGGHKHSHCG
jgi:hypothetical protein